MDGPAMTAQGFTLFDTAIGRCAIAWSEHGVVALQLPEASDAATRARLLKRHPQAREAPPPPHIVGAIAAIVALSGGEARDLSAIPLDMAEVPDFNRRVYEVARTIGPGATLTYGDIASRLGDPLLARDVGQALGQNPFAIIVPCHRVVAAGGKSGGFSAHGGAATKRRLLAIEGATSNAAPTLFDRHGGLDFALKPRGATASRRRG
jgi:methylated-DNA-[protein]-cysteine S-methyltransferase